MEGVSGQSWKRHLSLPPIFHVRAQSLDPSACEGGQGILPMSSGVKEMEYCLCYRDHPCWPAELLLKNSVGPWASAPKLSSIMRQPLGFAWDSSNALVCRLRSCSLV